MTQRLEPAQVVSMIAKATGITFTTKRIFNLRKAGQFPEPTTYVNAKTIYWDRADVELWIREHFPDDRKHRQRDHDTRRTNEVQHAR